MAMKPWKLWLYWNFYTPTSFWWWDCWQTFTIFYFYSRVSQESVWCTLYSVICLFMFICNSETWLWDPQHFWWVKNIHTILDIWWLDCWQTFTKILMKNLSKYLFRFNILTNSLIYCNDDNQKCFIKIFSFDNEL